MVIIKLRNIHTHTYTLYYVFIHTHRYIYIYIYIHKELLKYKNISRYIRREAKNFTGNL